jgi:hypothetical protein
MIESELSIAAGRGDPPTGLRVVLHLLAACFVFIDVVVPSSRLVDTHPSEVL